MLELDFAFLNMMNYNRQGLVARKSFLDRLAPMFFSPRVERLINFNYLGFKGCNVLLPLGQGNWSSLDLVNRNLMMQKSQALLNEYELPEMAVDRRLKDLFDPKQTYIRLRFGDNFIKSLALIFLNEHVKVRDVKKLILVGDISDMTPLIEYVSRYQIPISIQNYQPIRYEIMAYRLLYEKGLAISNSYISPHNWQKGDLIIFFESGYRRLTIASPQAFYIGLEDERAGLAPELENALQQAGLENKLYSLAPILESCLSTKAGIKCPDGEENIPIPEDKQRNKFEALIEAGEAMGLWDLFLDKGI